MFLPVTCEQLRPLARHIELFVTKHTQVFAVMSHTYCEKDKGFVALFELKQSEIRHSFNLTAVNDNPGLYGKPAALHKHAFHDKAVA